MPSSNDGRLHPGTVKQNVVRVGAGDKFQDLRRWLENVGRKVKWASVEGGQGEVHTLKGLRLEGFNRTGQMEDGRAGGNLGRQQCLFPCFAPKTHDASSHGAVIT